MYAVDYSNPRVAAAEKAQRRMPAWAALVIAVLALATSFLLGNLLFNALAPGVAAVGSDGFRGAALEEALVLLCFLSPFYLAAFAALAWERRPEPRPRFLRARSVLLGLAAGALAIGTALGLTYALGGLERAEAAAGAGVLALTLSAALLLFQVGAEELLFRGWLQPLLGARWGPWLGLIATAALFSAAHLVMQAFSALALLNGVLAGLFFGLLALRTGSLLAPIAAHWAWNGVEGPGVGASPNPGAPPLGSILDYDLAGSALFSGGEHALNGALGTTVALGAAVLVLVLWGPPKRRPPAA